MEVGKRRQERESRGGAESLTTCPRSSRLGWPASSPRSPALPGGSRPASRGPHCLCCREERGQDWASLAPPGSPCPPLFWGPASPPSAACIETKKGVHCSAARLLNQRGGRLSPGRLQGNHALKHPFAFIRTRKLGEQNAKALFLFAKSSTSQDGHADRWHWTQI